ncbi:MAG: sulfatase-like hydrolase/transferase, partial [Bacteroidales bacterium]|nr:sulfatase-like hydrolase/transferase [Bacteroidales bacterium]
DELGIADNTYIIYTSDNGYEAKNDWSKPVEDRSFYKAHPLLTHKYLVNEGGLRVPFIVAGPGIPANVSSRTPVVGWDIFPTVLDMVGAKDKVPAEIEGGSLLPLCTSGGKAKVERKDPFFVFRYTKRGSELDLTIVQDGYKYLRNVQSGKEFLWSLWEDLGEQNNLIDAMPEKADMLRKNMNEYFDRVNWDEKQHLNYPRGKKPGKKNAKKK